MEHTEKPIIFSIEMVKAILDSKKTQTRRVIKSKNDFFVEESLSKNMNIWPMFEDECGGYQLLKCPYGEIGTILWVRETWCAGYFNKPYPILCKQSDIDDAIVAFYYKANTSNTEISEFKSDFLNNGFKWKPSIHMPRKAARLFLRIKNIRVERVNEITEDDSKKEGVKILKCGDLGKETHVSSFRRLWNSINEKRGYGWNINPWVWVLDFEVIK